MKRILALFTAMLLVFMLPAATAEDTVSPLLRLYQAEQALLFATDNVTVSGHAVFSFDGVDFKTADLLHVQDGKTAMRDWHLYSPRLDGSIRENGYTVVNTGRFIYAFESYQHDRLRYVIDPRDERSSILGHTVAGDTLTKLAGLLLAQCGTPGECTAAAGENDTTVISIHLTEADVSPLLNTLLNSVLQYGIDRYSGYDYAREGSIYMDAAPQDYATLSEGLVYCLKSVSLRELTVTAVLDAQDRLQSLDCTAALSYEQKNADRVNELLVTFSQNACDYGTSIVYSDPNVYDHWGTI